MPHYRKFWLGFLDTKVSKNNGIIFINVSLCIFINKYVKLSDS